MSQSYAALHEIEELFNTGKRGRSATWSLQNPEMAVQKEPPCNLQTSLLSKNRKNSKSSKIDAKTSTELELHPCKKINYQSGKKIRAKRCGAPLLSTCQVRPSLHSAACVLLMQRPLNLTSRGEMKARTMPRPSAGKSLTFLMQNSLFPNEVQKIPKSVKHTRRRITRS